MALFMHCIALYTIHCGASDNMSIGSAPHCLGAHDESVWNRSAHNNFSTFMQNCSKECWGAAPCVTDCVHETQNLSVPCSACFGDLAACTTKKCLSPCMSGGPSSGACRACVRQYCDAPFSQCSGLCV